jgi:hypothetical protein
MARDCSVFEAAGGTPGLRALARAWHQRVMADEIVGHAFSHGFHPQHIERLAAYWTEALGGPSAYTENLLKYSTTTSRGRPPQRCPATSDLPMTCPAVLAFPAGLGMDYRHKVDGLSLGPQPTGPSGIPGRSRVRS